jgi:hypothetical protein
MNGRIGAGRMVGIDTQRDGPDQESMMDELRRSNQVLTQKVYPRLIFYVYFN